MKTARLLACCLLIFPLAGPALRSVPNPRAKSLPLSEETPERETFLQAGLVSGAELFRAGRYNEAAAKFRGLAAASLASNELRLAARATGNMGGCLFALHQYQPALRAFLEARHVAQTAGDASAIAAFDANIASLYTEMGDLEAAARWIEGTRERLTNAKDRRLHLPELLLQLATIRARQQRLPEAAALFRQGIDGADRAGDLNLYAIGWNRFGEELLKRGDLAGAEPALLEAYRVRKLHRLALDTSYRNLGRLRLEQGDLRSASALLDRAVELAAGPQGQIPTWDLYHYRGRARLAQGRLREALDDLRTAVRLGRAWRWSATPGDTSRIGEEGWLDRVHSAFIEAGNRLYLETGDEALVRETFEALEENRASSLRLLRAGKSGSLPPEYWEALLALQRAEIQALRSGKAADQAASAAARARVARLEASFASRPAVSEGDLLRRAQAALHADSALFSFHLGGDISWMWAVDRTHIELYALPPRAEIAGLVRNAVGATESDSAETAAAGAALYEALFGRLPARFRNKPNWVVALDESLFDAPLAALVVRGEARPAYLVELHATQAIPGVGWWLDAAERPAAPASPLFVGIGDPVYNAADPRLTTRQRASAARPAIPGQLAAEGFALPRLVASGAEIEACARAWTGDRILLTGTSASPQNLSEQLKRNPEVVHFATHVVESTARPSDGAIALSLSEGGGAQLLGPGEIADWRIRARLVAISGCHSAAGDVLPGTGLLGLTRAWLAAGADSVAGSRWATPDETGALFSSLYRNLRARPGTGPAQALRAAQLEMLRSGDWRAKPRYWGAYFVIGIEGVQ